MCPCDHEKQVKIGFQLLAEDGWVKKGNWYKADPHEISLSAFRDYQGKRGLAIYYEAKGQGTQKVMMTMDGLVLAVGCCWDTVWLAERAPRRLSVCSE